MLKLAERSIEIDIRAEDHFVRNVEIFPAAERSRGMDSEAGRYDLILIKTLRVYEKKIISARQHVLRRRRDPHIRGEQSAGSARFRRGLPSYCSSTLKAASTMRRHEV